MKKISFILLFLLLTSQSWSREAACKMIIGFQTGFSAPLSVNDYSIPRYKIGLPSFSYAASIEKRFTINNQLNFSLQYSITFFKILQQNLDKNCARLAKAEALKQDFSSSISVNNIYKLKDNINLVTGIGVSTPHQFQTMKPVQNEEAFSFTNKKYLPALNPFFVVGVENRCTLFRKNLILSIQYNIGFLPFKNQPAINKASTEENQFMQSISIGLKYMY